MIEAGKTITYTAVILLLLSTLSLQAATPCYFKTLLDYKARTPCVGLNHPIDTVAIRLGIWGLGHSTLPFIRLHMSKAEARSMGQLFAIAEGLTDYIKVNSHRLSKRSRYAKAEPVGPYLVYQDVHYYVDSRLPFIWAAYPAQMILDKGTGKRQALNGHFLKRLMTSKPDLLLRFKQDKQRGKKLKDYLIAYYQTS